MTVFGCLCLQMIAISRQILEPLSSFFCYWRCKCFFFMHRRTEWRVYLTSCTKAYPFSPASTCRGNFQQLTKIDYTKYLIEGFAMGLCLNDIYMRTFFPKNTLPILIKRMLNCLCWPSAGTILPHYQLTLIGWHALLSWILAGTRKTSEQTPRSVYCFYIFM